MTALQRFACLAPLALGGLYILWMWWTRQQLIRSAYEGLGAYVAGVSGASPEAKAELEAIYKAAGRAVQPRHLAGLRGFSDERVLRGWRTARTVELRHLHALSSSEVCARLTSLAPALEVDPDPVRRELAQQVRAALERPPADTTSAGYTHVDLLHEAMRANFDSRDTLYETLAAENLRAKWLAYFGTALATVIALAFGHGGLILVGAVGGLLSRLARVLRHRPLPNDYGASWGVLALAPVAGGLAGWASVLLIGALNDAGLSILAAPGVQVTWRGPGALELSLAFLFGFSERLFNRTITSATEKLLPAVDAPLGSGTTASAEGQRR